MDHTWGRLDHLSLLYFVMSAGEGHYWGTWSMRLDDFNLGSVGFNLVVVVVVVLVVLVGLALAA